MGRKMKSNKDRSLFHATISKLLTYIGRYTKVRGEFHMIFLFLYDLSEKLGTNTNSTPENKFIESILEQVLNSDDDLASSSIQSPDTC